MKDFSDRFKASYENGVLNNFLVFSTENIDDFQSYQVEMLRNSKNNSYLQIEVIVMDSYYSCKYNITGKQTLYNYISNNVLTPNKLNELILKTLRPIIDCKGYMLSENSFLCDVKYIYYGNNEISYVYLPFKFDGNVSDDIKKLILSILKMAKIADDDMYKSELEEYVESEKFNIPDFVLKLNINKNKAQPESENYNTDEVAATAIEVENDLIKPINHLKKYANTEIPFKSKKPIKKEKSNNVSASNKENTVDESKRKEMLQRGIIFQGAVILIAAALVLSGNLDSLGDKVSVYGGIGIIVIALSSLIWKNIMPYIRSSENNVAKDKKIKEVTKIKKINEKPQKEKYNLNKTEKNTNKKNTIEASNDMQHFKEVDKENNSRKTINEDYKELINDDIEEKSDKKVDINTIVAQSKLESIIRSDDKENNNIKKIDVKEDRIKDKIAVDKKNIGFDEKKSNIIEEIKIMKEDNKNEIEEIEEEKTGFLKENSTQFLEEQFPPTVFLKEEIYPEIKFIKDGKEEVVKIDSKTFIFGRARGRVNMILSNESIGKMHAKIEVVDSKYYLIDLESKNGTYLNDVKLKANVKKELKNNDKITLANMELTFCIPEE